MYGDNPPVKAIIVGAGIAGISTAIVLSQKIKNLTVTIYDRNSQVLTFAPNTQWSEYYSKGKEIQAYYEEVCRTYGLLDHIRLNHEVTHAQWNSDQQNWEVQVRDNLSAKDSTETADFFILCQGRINVPFYPEIPDLDKFQGEVVHTARWPDKFSYQGKRVAVVGNGASGQQILPNIFPDVAHIDHYVRSKTYVAPTFREGLKQAQSDNPGAYSYTEEEKRRFAEDPESYLSYRQELDKGMSGKWYGFAQDSDGNEGFRKQLLENMLRRLGGDEQWLERLKPDYLPGCKRLTPAPGYLECLKQPKVEFIDNGITRATSRGLVTEDGQEREIDIIIFATGFKSGFYPRFPIITQDGDLSQNWRPGGKIGYPATYLGIMAADAPNFFIVLQAQGNSFGGSVPLHCEVSAGFIAKVIRKLIRDGYKAGNPSKEAATDFNDKVSAYFEGSVVASSCNSWFKLGEGSNRIVVGWPGTTRHRIETLAEPRWEDFEFRAPKRGGAVNGLSSRKANRFDFWGDGNTAADITTDSIILLQHLTLNKAGKADLKELHASAW